jgi:adenine-specific DNA-methyltransferase
VEELGIAGFYYPKPIYLLKQLVQVATKGSGIVLDFFAGSCTTAHAVMQLNAEDGGNRKFICVQLAEPCEQETEAFKAGFKTIADIGKERIRRAAKKIKKDAEGNLKFDKNRLDLGFKVLKLEQSNFKQWRENVKTGEELKEQMKMFVDNTTKGAKPDDMLFEIILKNSRFDLNVKVSKESFDGVDYYKLATENKDFSATEGTEHTEKTNKDFEIVCLAPKITKKLIDKVLSQKPEKFTCLDIAFKDNDQLKTNTALQMEAAKIEFKVI